MLLLLAVGITVMGFLNINDPNSKSIALYIAPCLLAISSIVSFVTKRANYKVALFEVLFIYLGFCAVFVGIGLPITLAIKYSFDNFNWTLVIIGAGFGLASLLSFVALNISLRQHLTRKLN